MELPRADLNIPTHFVTLLDALMEDGSRANPARIQNPARAARPSPPANASNLRLISTNVYTASAATTIIRPMPKDAITMAV